jgi:hypothetical protein
MLKILASLSLAALDKVVLDYIKEHPGSRLFQIDKDTIKSHHNWGTKYIVQRLEDSGKVAVFREHQGRKIAPRYYATI